MEKTGSISDDFGTMQLPLLITKKGGDKVKVTLELPEELNVGQAEELQKIQEVIGEGAELEGETLLRVQQTFCALITDWSWTDEISPASLRRVGMEGFMDMLTPVMNHYGFGVEVEEDEALAPDSPKSSELPA